MKVDLAILGAPNFLWDALNALKTYTKACTLFTCRKNKSLLSITYGSLVPLKIRFRKECRFDSGHPHHRVDIAVAKAVISRHHHCNLIAKRLLGEGTVPGLRVRRACVGTSHAPRFGNGPDGRFLRGVTMTGQGKEPSERNGTMLATGNRGSGGGHWPGPLFPVPAGERCGCAGSRCDHCH